MTSSDRVGGYPQIWERGWAVAAAWCSLARTSCSDTRSPSMTVTDPPGPSREDPRRDDDVPTELQARVEDTRRDLEQAVADLRATMSDEQALDEYGIDVDRLLP